jgi:glutaminase
MPGFTDLPDYLHRNLRAYPRTGQVADTIPENARVPADGFGTTIAAIATAL